MKVSLTVHATSRLQHLGVGGQGTSSSESAGLAVDHTAYFYLIDLILNCVF